MSAGRVQIFVYPEELEHVEPERLAEHLLELGADAVSLAVSYHRARRILPRYGRISVLSRRAFYLEPDAASYGAMAPPRPAAPEWPERLLRFRSACAQSGLAFRAWVVALHDDDLAAAHPDAAATLLDGSPAGHALCPAVPKTVEYAAALVSDVARQLSPDAVDVEAALYPAWEPSYTLTLSLGPLAESTRRLAGQCFCASCRELAGSEASSLQARVRRAAGPPFSSAAHDDPSLAEVLGAMRSAGAARLTGAVAEAARAAGTSACFFVSGAPEDASVRGVSPESLAAVDDLLFGCGPLRGSDLLTRFAGLRTLTGRAAAVSMNWVPERAGELAVDAERVAAAGAAGLALYNLTLVPDEGLADFRAAAAAFRAA
ncbi:MAG TPA: hypothetical protein VFJ78_07390 [Gaiellaceae bacterium]|nr:hypothetical protein [Gaiellaceae bacterium]